MSAKVTRIGTRELYQSLNGNPMAVYKEAVQKGRTLSKHLEIQSPSENGDGLDAFERLLQEAGIITHSDPAGGYWASKASEFVPRGEGTSPAKRMLLTEFFARNWRKVSFRPRQERAIYLSTDGVPGSWQRPYFDAQEARWSQDIAPAVPLSEIIARTEPIEGQDYRSFYLTYSAANVRMFRLGESAEIPIAKLQDSERTIQLKKYGRGLQASYELLNRMRVDKLALQIQRMAVQSEIDKVAAILSIIVNGDGNSGTSATNYNLTTLDTAAAAGTLTLKGWLSFRKKLANPYILTTALMQEAVALQLELLNTGSGNVPLVQIEGLTAMGRLQTINLTADAVRYGWDSNAPSLKILGIDRRQALEQLTMIGGEVSEMERFIQSQTQLLTMTEWNGFAVMDPNAMISLDVNA